MDFLLKFFGLKQELNEKEIQISQLQISTKEFNADSINAIAKAYTERNNITHKLQNLKK